MIQKGTFLRVIDNSGGKRAECIHVYGGYRKRYAKIGDTVMVAVKSAKNKENIKIRKGDTSRALIVSSKVMYKNFKYRINTAILISAQNKFMGTRVFIPVVPEFRATRYVKLLMIASGIIKK